MANDGPYPRNLSKHLQTNFGGQRKKKKRHPHSETFNKCFSFLLLLDTYLKAVMLQCQILVCTENNGRIMLKMQSPEPPV